MAKPMYMLCDGALGCDCPRKREEAITRLEEKRIVMRKIRWRGITPQHGERRMYQRGCRCIPCNQANNYYVNKHRA